MKVDVTFVNFPVADSVRQLVASKIEDHVSKFANRVANARAVFQSDGPNHTVKLHVTSGDLHTHVSATSTDVSKCVDLVIDKLDASLRKVHAKKKERRHDLSTQEKLARAESLANGEVSDEFFDDEDGDVTAVGS